MRPELRKYDVAREIEVLFPIMNYFFMMKSHLMICLQESFVVWHRDLLVMMQKPSSS